MSLSLSSSAFLSNASIPGQYTCEGSDISPPLRWQDTSPETKSYVLLVDDPDAPAGVWDHWVLFNIPKNIRQLQEGADIPLGAVSGLNSWGQVGYRGPCPPSGRHRYFFRLYALDQVLTLDETASKKDVLHAMKGHVVAQAELIGVYQKK